MKILETSHPFFPSILNVRSLRFYNDPFGRILHSQDHFHLTGVSRFGSCILFPSHADHSSIPENIPSVLRTRRQPPYHFQYTIKYADIVPRYNRYRSHLPAAVLPLQSVLGSILQFLHILLMFLSLFSSFSSDLRTNPLLSLPLIYLKKHLIFNP